MYACVRPWVCCWVRQTDNAVLQRLKAFLFLSPYSLIPLPPLSPCLCFSPSFSVSFFPASCTITRGPHNQPFSLRLPRRWPKTQINPFLFINFRACGTDHIKTAGLLWKKPVGLHPFFCWNCIVVTEPHLCTGQMLIPLDSNPQTLAAKHIPWHVHCQEHERTR